jgi:hypothetical protein
MYPYQYVIAPPEDENESLEEGFLILLGIKILGKIAHGSKF